MLVPSSTRSVNAASAAFAQLENDRPLVAAPVKAHTTWLLLVVVAEPILTAVPVLFAVEETSVGSPLVVHPRNVRITAFWPLADPSNTVGAAIDVLVARQYHAVTRSE